MHHFLKRIAVASGTMSGNVKKEVDIMRILRGHPNIVYLIDAAWLRMDDGVFEVFILLWWWNHRCDEQAVARTFN